MVTNKWEFFRDFSTVTPKENISQPKISNISEYIGFKSSRMLETNKINDVQWFLTFHSKIFWILSELQPNFGCLRCVWWDRQLFSEFWFYAKVLMGSFSISRSYRKRIFIQSHSTDLGAETCDWSQIPSVYAKALCSRNCVVFVYSKDWRWY